MEIMIFLGGVFVGTALGAGAMFMLILHDGQALDEEAR